MSDCTHGDGAHWAGDCGDMGNLIAQPDQLDIGDQITAITKDGRRTYTGIITAIDSGNDRTEITIRNPLATQDDFAAWYTEAHP